MMGRLDWRRTCFAMHGHTYQTDEIMSKYRPIAPKPTLHNPSYLCKSTTSDSHSVVDFSSTLPTTHMGNSIAKSGHTRNANRKRRASDFPSPRVLKRGRNLGREENSTHNIVGTSITWPNTVYHFHGSSSAEKSSFEKGLYKSHAGFEGLNIKTTMNSSGEVGVENPATDMEVVPVSRMAETTCDSGCPKYLELFPLVNDFQQEEEKNLVTLPLLPQTPDSASNPTSGSCHGGKIPLRLFGRDLSHKESSVPIVGLSFL
ncbi:hypothetical protein KI387_008161, partial [Taxus chinensis]